MTTTTVVPDQRRQPPPKAEADAERAERLAYVGARMRRSVEARPRSSQDEP
jgi:hypothetical protein